MPLDDAEIYDGCTLLCFRYQEIISSHFFTFRSDGKLPGRTTALKSLNLASVVVVKDRTILKLYI